MATITADLTKGSVVEIRNGRHVWHADEPPEVDGTDVGPNPYELLLGSLAACTCITLVFYARHKQIRLESVSARFHYDKVHADDCEDCEDDVAGWLDRIRSEIFIEGDFTDEQRARLKQIALRCPVHKTLQNGVTFTEESVIVG